MKLLVALVNTCARLAHTALATFHATAINAGEPDHGADETPAMTVGDAFALRARIEAGPELRDDRAIGELLEHWKRAMS